VHLLCLECLQQLLETKAKHFGVESITKCDLLTPDGTKCSSLWTFSDFDSAGLDNQHTEKVRVVHHGLESSHLLNLSAQFKREEGKGNRACPKCHHHNPPKDFRWETVYHCCKCRTFFCNACEAATRSFRKSKLKHVLGCNGKIQVSDETGATLLNELIRQYSWQACPGCHSLVERVSGCNYMYVRTPQSTSLV